MSADPITYPEAKSSLCSTGHSSRILNGIFYQLMVQLFSDPDNLRDPNAKEFTWVGTNTGGCAQASNIYIAPHTRWDLQHAGNRPSIVVKRNGMRPMRLGINDQYMGGKPLPGTPDPNEYFAVKIISSMTFFPISRTGDHVEVLGWEVFSALLEWAPILRRDLQLMPFQVSEIGPVRRVKGADHLWGTTVVVTFAFDYAWSLNPELPWLNSIFMRVNSVLSDDDMANIRCS